MEQSERVSGGKRSTHETQHQGSSVIQSGNTIYNVGDGEAVVVDDRAAVADVDGTHQGEKEVLITTAQGLEHAAVEIDDAGARTGNARHSASLHRRRGECAAVQIQSAQITSARPESD